MYEPNEVTGRGEFSISLRDLDGSLTGNPGAIVLKPDVYYANKRHHYCKPREGWNLSVCRGSFAKVSALYETEEASGGVEIIVSKAFPQEIREQSYMPLDW